MEPRLERAAAVLSPLEESSAEVSRDSGIVSQSASTLSMLSEALSSGSVSHSPSFNNNNAAAAVPPAAPDSPSPSPSPNLSPRLSVGAAEPQAAPEPPDEEVLRQTAHSYSSYIRASAGEEILSLEKSLEEMLTRVDEFVGMLDMIRNDTSQIVNISLPQIQKKSKDMREIYRKIDNLEAFVKMVAANVSAMEDQVTQAEGEVRTIPGAFKKIFRTMSVPGFLNKPASPKRTPQQHHELPTVFRTDEYFKPPSEQ